MSVVSDHVYVSCTEMNYCSQILLFGTAVYNGSVWTFSDVSYAQLAQADGIIKTEPHMASPSITRSTLIYKPSPTATSTDRDDQQHSNKPKNYNSTGNRYNEV